MKQIRRLLKQEMRNEREDLIRWREKLFFKLARDRDRNTNDTIYIYIYTHYVRRRLEVR